LERQKAVGLLRFSKKLFERKSPKVAERIVPAKGAPMVNYASCQRATGGAGAHRGPERNLAKLVANFCRLVARIIFAGRNVPEATRGSAATRQRRRR
jgi:hypothetical protein